MRCKNCGKRLRAKEKFCTICGYYNGEEDKENVSTNTLTVDNANQTENDSFQTENQASTETKEEGEFFSLKTNASGTKEDEFYYKDEKFLEAYIGEDYKLIKKSPFNIYAFLLNWMYVLYRKMYVIGIIGLIITGIIIKLNPKNLFVYLIITMLLIGFLFNKVYIFVSKVRVEYLLKKNEGTDNFTMEDICNKKGGVNVRNALIIYLIFLLLIFFSIFNFSFNKSYNKKYWKENSENRATCISLLKTAYKDLEKMPEKGKIVEGACAIDKTINKEYNIYLKIKEKNKFTYVYYKTDNNYLLFSNNTEDIEELETKSANKTITDFEVKKLKAKKKILEDYLTTAKKDQEENKLIKTKKNTSEKINYIILKEEITR